MPADQFSKVFKEANKIDNFSKSRGNIEIGHDVWIGGRSTILSGVKIGTGAVIAAGSVVVNDVEPYTVSGGNPNKEIKKRFDDDTIKKILSTEWWLMRDQEIDILSKYLLSNDIKNFFTHVDLVKNNYY